MSAVREILDYLADLDPYAVTSFTLSDPHCDRGSYSDVAFAMTREPSTVAEVYAVIASVIGETYQGYKGGDFTMHAWTDCCIGESSYDVGDALSVGWLRAEMLIATLTAQRDAARDIAARLEGELARVREIVTAWSLGETSRDEMVLWAIRDIVGLTPAKPDNPTPWPHPDAVIAEGES